MSTNVGAISATLTLEDLLTRVAEKATQALDRFGKEAGDTTNQTNKLDKANERTSKSFSSLERGIENVATKLAGIALGFLSVNSAMSLIEKSIDAISESETATATLEARIKSTGGVAGKTADEINRFAESLSKLIKRDDEEIALAAAELLKFTDISGEQFERIIKLAADMAGPTGDLVAEVERLGKAFQEPDEAMTLLARSVGKFTDAEEEAIKKLAKSGDEAGAAAKMMEILEGRVGGTAEAYGKTLGGALAGIKISWENQLELLQEGLSPALSQIAKDFEAYITSAEGQKRVIALGHDLGDLITTLADNVENLADGIAEIDLGSLVDLANMMLKVLGIAQDIGAALKWVNPMYWELKLLEKAFEDTADEADNLYESVKNLGKAPSIDPKKLFTLPPGVLGTPGAPKKPDHSQIDKSLENEIKQRERAIQRIQDHIRELENEATAKDRLFVKLRESSDAFIAEERAQAQNSEVLKARLTLLEKGVTLSDANEKALRHWTGAVFDSSLALERYEDLLSRVADNLVESRNRVAGFRGLLDDIGLDPDTSGVDAFVRSISASSLALKIMKAELSGLAPESATFKSLQEQIATETEAVNNALNEGAFRIRAWQVAQSSSAKSAQASVEKEISLIKERNRVMSEGGILGVRDLDRQRAINAQVSELLSQIKHAAGETASEWTKRWLAAAKEIRSTLEAQADIELAFDLKNSLRTVWDDFNDLTEDVNDLLGKGLLTEDQARRIVARAHPVFGQMVADLENSFESATIAIADGLVEAASGGENAFEDFAESLESILKRMIADWLAQWFKAMAQWLAQWIATQTKAKAASATLQGPTQDGGNLSSVNMGGGSSTAMGVMATAAIFAALYVGVSAWIKSHKDYAAQVTFQLNRDVGAAVNNIAGDTRQINGLIDSVKQAGDGITEFLKALGGELEGLSGKVIIGSKGRGKNTTFFVELENGIKEWFNTYEEAVEHALIAALKSSDISGFSALMQQGLKEFDGGSLDELGEFLGDLREISELDWTDSARQVRATTDHFLGLWESLDKLTTITPDVLTSFDQLGAGIVNAFQSWFDRIQGKEKPKSKADQLLALQNEAKIANAQKHLMEARIRTEIFELEAERRFLEAKIKQTRIGVEIEGEGLKHKNTLLNVRADQIQAEASLEQQRIEFINAELNALNEILANLPKDIDIGSLKLPKLGGSGDPFASLRDFIKDRRFELSLRGLSDYRRSLKELDREYAERMKEAKGNKKLQAELLALEREERRALNEDKRKQTLGDVDAFLGTKTGFDEIRETAADLIKEIEDSPFGNARKAGLIGRVLEGLEKQLDDLAKKSAMSLFGEMLGDLEKFGVDEALQLEVRKNMAILEHTLKMEHYRAEIEILRAEGRLTAETMALLDRSFQALQGIDPLAIFGPPANDDTPPRKSMEERRKAANESASEAFKELADAIKSARDKLKSYQDDELTPFAQRMKEINADFDEIIKVLGATPEVLATYNNAIDRAKDDARELLSGYTNDNEDPLRSVIDGIERDFEEIREALGDTPEVMDAFSSAVAKATKETYQALIDFHEDLTGLGSSATIEQQFNAAEAELNRLMDEVEAGNTAEIANLVSQGKVFEDLLGRMFGTSTGGFIEGRADLRERVADVLAGVGLLPGGVGGSASALTAASLPLSALTFTDSTSKVISATNHVADIMQSTSTRQETVLVDIRDILREIANDVREARAENYGNGNTTLKIGG